MTLPSVLSPLDEAVRRAQVAFAANVAGDPAVDSIVYDLQAYEPTVIPSLRYVALTREGVYGFYADADVASMAVVNRRAFPPETDPDPFAGSRDSTGQPRGFLEDDPMAVEW